MVRHAFTLAVLVPVGVLLLMPSPAAQVTGTANPPLVITSLYGRDLYTFYCASCHGRDGAGGGPVAAVLTVPPADLTRIALRHGGNFPRERVAAFVTGTREPLVAAHGSPEMPVWGPIFKGLDGNDALNHVRIENIVDHLASLQKPR